MGLVAGGDQSGQPLGNGLPQYPGAAGGSEVTHGSPQCQHEQVQD